MRRNAFLTLSVLACCGCGGSGAGGDWVAVSGGPTASTFLDVWAFSPGDVWFVDGGPDVHRYDGASFSTLATPAGGLSCIFALSASDIWLCAGDQALHYDGSAFTAVDVLGPTGLDGLTDIWASSPSDVWMVGDDAIIAHYDGAAWSRAIAGSPFKASIWGSGPTDIYALDTFDLVHYDGTEWSEVSFAGPGGEGQVWGTSAGDVWLMTGSSTLGHYDGATWTEVETGDLIGDLTAVWGPAPDDLWAAGTAGAIAHFNGTSWTQVAHQPIGAPDLRQFVAVHGTSTTDVWAVGYQLGEGGSTGILYHHAP
jgi:hypothetical protein